MQIYNIFLYRKRYFYKCEKKPAREGWNLFLERNARFELVTCGLGSRRSTN